MWNGSTALWRRDALIDLGYTVQSIDSTTHQIKWLKKIIFKCCNRAFKHMPDFIKVNSQILQALDTFTPDILWIDKGLLIEKHTLKEVKNIMSYIKIVSYSPDDMLNRNNQSRNYLKTLVDYDLVITTKSYNVNELLSIGAKKVYFTQNAYHPTIHKPLKDSFDRPKYRWDISFIGAYEADRAKQLLYLCCHNITVHVFGPSWSSLKGKDSNLIVDDNAYYGDAYAEIIRSSRINICFLRKANRDLQTTRSIEIPACGGFMLAERTPEHEALFVEDEEAVFFASKEELACKIDFYLSHTESIERIRYNGFMRCINSGYSYAEIFKQIINSQILVNAN